jgi:hypothetical protein
VNLENLSQLPRYQQCRTTPLITGSNMTDVSANVLQGKKNMKKIGKRLETDTDGDFSRLGAASEV